MTYNDYDGGNQAWIFRNNKQISNWKCDKNKKLTCCTFLAGNLIKSKKLVFNNKGVKEGEKKNNNTF